MLRWRLLSAAVLISALIGLMWLDAHEVLWGRPGFWLLPVAVLFLGLGTLELLDLFRAQGFDPRRDTALIGVTLVTIAAAAPNFWTDYPATCPVGRNGWPLIAFGLSVALVLVGEMRRFYEPGRANVHAALGVFAVAYVGLLGSFLVLIRQVRGNATGLAALVSLILVVKMSDAGAYFAGRMFGRHKMSPILSPKKTLEGGIGGVLASIASSGLFFVVIAPRWLGEQAPEVATWRWVVYGGVLAIAGMIGDLAESMLKRDSAIKDASKRLPGLGGVLDVLDSLLVGAPIAYAFWITGLIPNAK